MLLEDKYKNNSLLQTNSIQLERLKSENDTCRYLLLNRTLNCVCHFFLLMRRTVWNISLTPTPLNLSSSLKFSIRWISCARDTEEREFLHPLSKTISLIVNGAYVLKRMMCLCRIVTNTHTQKKKHFIVGGAKINFLSRCHHMS